MPAPLRIVVFSPSIVSDWHNPTATTVRAVMRALTAAGHEVLHLEERKNQPTVDLLRARGSSALRAFTERYGDLPYRTYELPTGLERTVWFVRQVSTADALVVLDDVPGGIGEEAARVQTRHLTKIRWSRDPEVDAPWADFVLSPKASASSIELGPAVEALSGTSDVERAETLLIAYDDQDLADATRAVLDDLNMLCLTVGDVAGDHWTPESEVALTERYQRAKLAVMTTSSDDSFAAARSWLPVAAGCRSITIRSRSDLDNLLNKIVDSDIVEGGNSLTLPDLFNATVAARRLVALIRPDWATTLLDTSHVERD